LKAFTLYLNGERIYSASLGDDGHVLAHATLTPIGEDDGCIQVGGFDISDNRHVQWCDRPPRVGDEVRIVVEEVERSNEPQERKSVEKMDCWARSL
jgi:hypothetical protein